MAGEIDHYQIDIFKKAVYELADSDANSIIIDLKNVTFIDSSGIGVLVSGYKKIAARRGHFGLLNVGNDIYALLKLSTIDKVIPIYNSEEDLD